MPDSTRSALPALLQGRFSRYGFRQRLENANVPTALRSKPHGKSRDSWKNGRELGSLPAQTPRGDQKSATDHECCPRGRFGNRDGDPIEEDVVQKATTISGILVVKDIKPEGERRSHVLKGDARQRNIRIAKCGTGCGGAPEVGREIIGTRSEEKRCRDISENGAVESNAG